MTSTPRNVCQDASAILAEALASGAPKLMRKATQLHDQLQDLARDLEDPPCHRGRRRPHLGAPAGDRGPGRRPRPCLHPPGLPRRHPRPSRLTSAGVGSATAPSRQPTPTRSPRRAPHGRGRWRTDSHHARARSGPRSRTRTRAACHTLPA